MKRCGLDEGLSFSGYSHGMYILGAKDHSQSSEIPRWHWRWRCSI